MDGEETSESNTALTIWTAFWVASTSGRQRPCLTPADFLWRSTPTITRLILLSSFRHERLLVGEDGQSYLEPGNPLLGHDPTIGAQRERSPIKSHNHKGWAVAMASVPPSTSTPVWPDRCRRRSLK